MDYMHPYEKLSLFTVGLLLGSGLIGMHLLMILKPGMVQRFLRTFPRHPMMGQLLMGVGLGWFWLLVAPENMGVISALCMDFGEFNSAKPLLRILVPVALVLVCMSIRDFLAVRALGLVGLLLAAPLLESAFLKEPTTRLLIPIYSYAMITASLFWVGKPYVFRDMVTWATASPSRWMAVSCAGLTYGIAMTACALLYWRGY